MTKAIKEPCPQCRREGKDSSGDNLARYPDGSAHCFSCGYREPAGGVKARVSKLDVSQVKTYEIGHDPARKIPNAVIEMYHIRRQTSGPDVTKVWYPYYDESSNMLGAKGRDVSTKKFMVAGELGGVFGKHACTEKCDKLLVTEGEEDALALKAALLEAGRRYHVVSLPNGASLDATTREDLDFFKRYDHIWVVFDADKPGRKCADEFCDWAGMAAPNVYNVQLDPTVGKDPSDYWRSGKSADLMAAISGTKKYEPEGIVNGKDIDIDSLLIPLEEGYKIPYPKLQDKLHGLRRGEILTVCAGSGIGKSTMTRELAYGLLDQGCRVALVALENTMDEAVKGMLAIDMDVPLTTLKFHPPAKEDLQPHYDKLFKSGNAYFWQHFGRMDSSNLLSKLYYYAKSCQCDFIVLDHLSKVVAASNERDERKAIDNIMDQLAEMVVETGVGLIVVVHLKRVSGQGKSFSRGDEVELTDLRGSAALEQNSWAVVGMERDQQGDDADFSKIRVLKNRTFGFLGVADTLRYDPPTGRLRAYKGEE